jgi:hypothetical protein
MTTGLKLVDTRRPEKRSWASPTNSLVRRALGPVLAVKCSFLGMAMSSSSILSPLCPVLPSGRREARASYGEGRMTANGNSEEVPSGE